MKLTKKEQNVIEEMYYEKYYGGANWNCWIELADKKMMLKLFPRYISKRDDRLQLDWSKITMREYPEVYIKFLESKLLRLRENENKIYNLARQMGSVF